MNYKCCAITWIFLNLQYNCKIDIDAYKWYTEVPVVIEQHYCLKSIISIETHFSVLCDLMRKSIWEISSSSEYETQTTTPTRQVCLAIYN